MEKEKKIALIMTTVCVLLINAANLIEYIDTGNPGSVLSNICVLAGDISMVIAWISHFLDKKKQA